MKKKFKKGLKKNIGWIILAVGVLCAAISTAFSDSFNAGMLIGYLVGLAGVFVIFANSKSDKHNLFKVISGLVLIGALFSWIIPAGQFNGSEVASSGLTRVGLFDLINYPLLSFQYFIQMIVFILVVGGFYGILGKTGAYNTMTQKIAKIFKGKEKLFLVITAFIFAGFASVFGFTLIMFVFIPLFVTVILLLGYDKLVAFLTTCVSLLIGIIGGTYNIYTLGYLNQLTGSEFSSEIITKISLFAICFVLFIIFTLKYANKVKKNSKNSVLPEETKDVFVGDEAKGKKKIWPVVTVLSLLFVVIFMGSVPWADAFSVATFTDFHTWVTTLEIASWPVIGYIIGNLSGLGGWYFAEITMMVIIASLVLSLGYKLGLNGTIEAFGSGVKKLFRIACLMTFAMVVVVITAYHPYFVTISDYIMGLTDSFNVFTTSVVAALGSMLNVEMVYLSQGSIPFITAMFTGSADLLVVIFQAIYGLTMFVAPTSLVLILGLEYLEIPYKTWLKFSWKLVLELLVILLAVFVIVSLI